MKYNTLILLPMAIAACSMPAVAEMDNMNQSTIKMESKMNTTIQSEDIREIYLAGGCFWGIEAYDWQY